MARMRRWGLALALTGLVLSLAPGRVLAAPPATERAPDFRYPSLFPPAPTVGAPQRRIAVDLSDQQLIAFEGQTPVRAFPVSTGDWEHPTIVGDYSVQWKREQIDLIGPDYYYHDVPHVMMFAKPFYIHAAPWRTEFGVANSRGCVTLAPADAAWLFDWAEVGTAIRIWW